MPKRIPIEAPKPLAHKPFGQLAGAHKPMPAGSALPDAPKMEPNALARAVVRLERKGRGGKEVTVVEQLALGARDLDDWTRALKGSLGCGGVVQGSDMVLQGDQRERVATLLLARGVKKVILGT